MTLRLGARTWDGGTPVVMAIVNRTPDSFHDRGATYGFEQARAASTAALAAGADIVDIGGVKAGPGADVTVDEERNRVVDLIAAVRADHPEAVISVDTWRSEVGAAAVAAGADLLNDAWGGVDPELAVVAAETGAGLVCTHAGHLPPRTRPHRIAYDDVVRDVVGTVVALAERAVTLGARPDGVLIDPGHDFGKNTRHSLTVTRHLGALVDTGWPVLVSLSRKDFVGETLDRAVPDRLAGTLGATAVSAWLGAQVFRAHDVAATRDVVDMVAAIAGRRGPAVARRGLA